MRKYSPENIQQTFNKYESYGQATQILALLSEGWESNQILKYILDTNWGLQEPTPEPEPPKIKIKKIRVTRRNYEKLKCPYCKVRSTPGPLQKHINTKHQDKLIISCQ